MNIRKIICRVLGHDWKDITLMEPCYWCLRCHRETHSISADKEIERQETLVLKAIKQYNKDWPNYCTKCGGWGCWESPATRDEPGDAGPCSCVEDGICPRCGEESINEVKHEQEGEETEVCISCGWETGDEGLPQL